MNFTIIAIAIFGFAELMLLILRLRRLILRHTEEKLETDVRLLSLHLPPQFQKESPKRGRPRKLEKKYPRHLYLPPNITQKQLAGLETFFKKHQDATGDRIVLHIPATNGVEQNIEVPYAIRWDNHLKENLATVLGGWA